MTAPSLMVRPAPGKGRGVFAARRLAAGETLEVAPAIPLDRRDTEAIAGTTLDDYYFAHPDDPEGGMIALGVSTLLNHSDRPNAESRFRRDPEAGWFVELHALQDVPAGAEITRRYACLPWFDPD